MTSQTVRSCVQEVRPILSLNRDEARRRVISLYKAWYRQIPYIVRQFDINRNIPQCREKLREKFMDHKDIADIRVIDMLVIKGQMELKEVAEVWQQKGHIMSLYFKDSFEKKPTDFLSKFLSGN